MVLASCSGGPTQLIVVVDTDLAIPDELDRVRVTVTAGADRMASQLKGKLRYMAPEQASGGTVDRRSDIYALGVVLWEMLTMRRLFTVDDQFKLLEAVRNPTIPTPSSIRPDVPPRLEAAVMRALSIRPEDRFETAYEFRRALAEACPGALLADAAQLAALLRIAMSEQMAKSERLVASGATSLPGADAAESADEAALATVTISATGLEFLGASDPSQPSTEEPLPAAGPAATYVPAEPITSFGSGGGDRRRTIPHKTLIAVTAVAAIVALVVGVGFGTYAATRGERPSEIRATELPPQGHAPAADDAHEAPVPAAAVAEEPEADPSEPPPHEPASPTAVEPVAEPEPAPPEPAPRPAARPTPPARRSARRVARPAPPRPLPHSNRGAPLADEF